MRNVSLLGVVILIQFLPERQIDTWLVLLDALALLQSSTEHWRAIQGCNSSWVYYRWAGEKIVPELIGEIDPKEVAALAAEYLQSPDRLQVMHNRLLDLQMVQSDCKAGPAQSIALAVHQLLRYGAGTLPSWLPRIGVDRMVYSNSTLTLHLYDGSHQSQLVQHHFHIGSVEAWSIILDTICIATL